MTASTVTFFGAAISIFIAVAMAVASSVANSFLCSYIAIAMVVTLSKAVIVTEQEIVTRAANCYALTHSHATLPFFHAVKNTVTTDDIQTRHKK